MMCMVGCAYLNVRVFVKLVETCMLGCACLKRNDLVKFGYDVHGSLHLSEI